MTREEAKKALEKLFNFYDELHETTDGEYGYEEMKAIDTAIEALNANIVRCKDCKYQDECEEMVLFDINDDEVVGHRVYWCSYGRSE